MAMKLGWFVHITGDSFKDFDGKKLKVASSPSKMAKLLTRGVRVTFISNFGSGNKLFTVSGKTVCLQVFGSEHFQPNF